MKDEIFRPLSQLYRLENPYTKRVRHIDKAFYIFIAWYHICPNCKQRCESGGGHTEDGKYHALYTEGCEDYKEFIAMEKIR